MGDGEQVRLHPSIQEAYDRVFRHTVPLFRICRGEDFYRAAGQYMGTRVLVLLGGRRCLLTADHVWDELIGRGAEHFGMAVRDRGRRGQAVPTSLPAERHRGRVEALGPDLALVQLPEIDAAVAVDSGDKVYYDLGIDRPAPPRPCWLVLGAPGERVQARQEDQEWAMEVGLFGATLEPQRAERDGFDYADIPAWHGEAGRPQSFGGLSGSGLWRVGVEERDGAFAWEGSIALQGIAYFEIPDPTPGWIRCHGPDSLGRLNPRLS